MRNYLNPGNLLYTAAIPTSPEVAAYHVASAQVGKTYDTSIKAYQPAKKAFKAAKAALLASQNVSEPVYVVGAADHAQAETDNSVQAAIETADSANIAASELAVAARAANIPAAALASALERLTLAIAATRVVAEKARKAAATTRDAIAILSLMPVRATNVEDRTAAATALARRAIQAANLALAVARAASNTSAAAYAAIKLFNPGNTNQGLEYEYYSEEEE